MVQIQYKPNCSKVEVAISRNVLFHIQIHIGGLRLTNLFTLLSKYLGTETKPVTPLALIFSKFLKINSIKTENRSTIDGNSLGPFIQMGICFQINPYGLF